VIVSCPACEVNYRQVPPPTEAILARCSECDETFQMEPPQATYRLVPVAGAAFFEPRQAFETEVPALPGVPSEEPPAIDAGAAEPGVEPGTEIGSAAASEAIAAELLADGPSEAKTGSRLSIYGVFLGLLLVGVATASGYYLSLLGITDTLTGTAGGAGVGLLLAWAALRWTTRAR
jgi:hypothetical protein